jgi:hypothetical protein
MEHIKETGNRTTALLVSGGRVEMPSSQEMLRAVVVMTHAYLEDFIRTLAEALLPLAGEEAPNGIPLAGTFGRADAFRLGKLVRHRNKTVDGLIRESIQAYLDRSNLNSSTEVVSWLKKLGFSLTPEQEGQLATIQRMIQRRHQIVHRADRIKNSNGVYELQYADPAEVMNWATVAREFMFSLVEPILTRQVIPALQDRTFIVEAAPECG